jgi:hypothetical protein
MKPCSRCGERPQQKSHKYCRPCAREYERERYSKQNETPLLDRWKAKGKAKDHPAYRMVQSARERAKKKGLECTITLDDIVIPDACPVLGIPLDRRDQNHSPSLDRFDPTRGYTKDNVRVISYRANTIKNDATAEELRLVYEYVNSP